MVRTLVYEPQSEFPISFYEEFLQEIIRRDIQIITYADLFEGSSDFDHEHGFPQEFRAWNKSKKNDTTYLLIQHDIDNYPEFCKRMVDLESSYGIRSNIFMFVNRATKDGFDLSYKVDHEFFLHMQSRGYVIGYHQNALSLTASSPQDANRRFLSDVNFLKERYQVDFVVPHGGRGVMVCGEQKYNHDVNIPIELRQSLRWVYNKFGVKFSQRWSDGGLRKSRDPARLAKVDLIGAFLDSLEPGTRNFCLVHPQRWGENVNSNLNPMLFQQNWYQEMLNRHGDRT